MITPRATFGYLSYVNERNRGYRLEDFRRSLESMSLLELGDNHIVSVDNASSEDVRELLEAWGFDRSYRYAENFYDVSLFYTTVWHAVLAGSDYVGFLYDDSVVFDGGAVHACVDFLDGNPDVSCLRVARYDRENSRLYDTNFTPKESNPDSVRHFNSRSGAALVWSGPWEVGGRRFYKNNWHYTSRPCLWRLSSFVEMLKGVDQASILQGFEGHCMARYEDLGMITGALDGGLVSTTSVRNSARTNELSLDLESRTKVDVARLRAAFDEIRRMPS